jgi:hypothetical protein
MPDGKPANVPCVHWDQDMRCKIFGQAGRPAFCAGLQPSAEMCGDDRGQAIAWLEAGGADGACATNRRR